MKNISATKMIVGLSLVFFLVLGLVSALSASERQCGPRKACPKGQKCIDGVCVVTCGVEAVQ